MEHGDMVNDTAEERALTIIGDLDRTYPIRVEPAEDGMEWRVGSYEFPDGMVIDARYQIQETASVLEKRYGDLVLQNQLRCEALRNPDYPDSWHPDSSSTHFRLRGESDPDYQARLVKIGDREIRASLDLSLLRVVKSFTLKMECSAGAGGEDQMEGYWERTRLAEGLAKMPDDFMPDLSTALDPDTGVETRNGNHSVMLKDGEFPIRMSYVMSYPYDREMRARQPERDAALRERLWYIGEWARALRA